MTTIIKITQHKHVVISTPRNKHRNTSVRVRITQHCKRCMRLRPKLDLSHISYRGGSEVCVDLEETSKWKGSPASAIRDQNDCGEWNVSIFSAVFEWKVGMSLEGREVSRRLSSYWRKTDFSPHGRNRVAIPWVTLEFIPWYSSAAIFSCGSATNLSSSTIWGNLKQINGSKEGVGCNST